MEMELLEDRFEIKKSTLKLHAVESIKPTRQIED